MKWMRNVTLFVAGIAVGAVLTQSTAAQQNRAFTGPPVTGLITSASA